VNEASHLPVRFFQLFLDTLSAEIGPDTFRLILEKADLPADLGNPQAASRFTSASAAEAYARIQKAIRVFFGRGARGTLIRLGRLLWMRLLENASLQEKAQAQLIRVLPLALRRKPTLELLAHFLREKPREVTVHPLDLDLLLVDHASATTVDQTESGAICNVTLGLIQESLFWVTGHETDVEETSCRATGGDTCEFKIHVGGK
jgi:predicted hydrocarbon binding protein